MHKKGRGMTLRRGPGLIDGVDAHRGAGASIQTDARRWLCALFLAGSMVYLTGCGGGSSGTGEIESSGQVVDPACTPVASVDLAAVGLPTVEESSRADGTFSLAPDAADPGALPAEESDDTTGLSREPTCVLLVYDAGMVVAMDTYPAELLEQCSIEGLRAKDPGAAAALCGEDSTGVP